MHMSAAPGHRQRLPAPATHRDEAVGTPGLLAPAVLAQQRGIDIRHFAQGLGGLVAFLALVFVNRHDDSSGKV
jgi:hypothetical protein